MVELDADPVDPGFSALDQGFARFLGARSHLATEQRRCFERLLMRLSAQQSSGHSCLPLSDEEIDLAIASGQVANDRLTPLVLERNRLYLRRYWVYEQQLASRLKQMALQSFSMEGLAAGLARYFDVPATEVDNQREAARAAVTQGVTIITGGPGTGKTTTVVKILALLQDLHDAALHIALAAPTGKAAMRLQESIALNKGALNCSAETLEKIPDTVATLHRLLGAQPPATQFRHHADNPLPHDVVVVDETSMVDLALMSKLVAALKPGCRLILLGDKDQLASVESGAVLADLWQGLPAYAVELTKSHRFNAKIKVLADAVNQQQTDFVWDELKTGGDSVSLLEADPLPLVLDHYQGYFESLAKGATFTELLIEFNRFKVLCANRQGANSVNDINRRVEQAYLKSGDYQAGLNWYHGRPLMISSNHAGLQLYNGDVGLCLSDRENAGELRVHFLRNDGSIKKIRPAQMPTCETAYAMTIHKSQGSEFETVMILLPGQVNPVLSKELLYTAITRARRRVIVAAEQSVLAACVGRKVTRHSGLIDKLLSSE